METTDASGHAAARPRPWLLMALAVVVGVALAYWAWPVDPSVPQGRASNVARAPQNGETAVKLDSGRLDVRLEALEGEQGVAEEGERDPFRFQAKAAPPPPPPGVALRPVNPEPAGPPEPVGPPPPPPIGGTVKFIGVVEPKPGDRVAAFSDCRLTTYARESGVIFGQYRLVRIGVESVVVEYLDGRGRTTLRMQGQECVK